VGLLTLDEEEVGKYAAERDIEWESFAELTRHPKVRYRVDSQMAEVNKKLPSWETIKYWAILERDFEVGEELTPSLKVKRKVVVHKHQDLLDSLYR
jgi:long-chain acyl-CoA synthetase